MRTALELKHPVFSLAVLASLGWVRPASAQPSLTLSIDCPALSEDERAALEVRTRADLDVRGVADGRLLVSCSQADARVQWQGSDGPAREASLTLTPSASRVDSLLEAISSLVAARPVVPTAPVRPAARPEAVTPPRAEREPAPAAPVLALTAGGSGELWSGAALAGPRVGVASRIAGQLALDIWGGAKWAVTGPAQLRVRVLEAALGCSYRLDREGRWIIRAGGLVGALRVDADSPIEPSSRQALLVAGWGSAHYAVPLSFGSMEIGPEVRIHARPHPILVDDTQSAHQPVVTIGLSAAAVFDLVP